MGNDVFKTDQQYSVLVVDDDPLVRTLIEDVLKKKFKITCCQNASEAIRLLDTKVYDILIVDLVLPDRPGIEIAYHAKAQDEYIEIIIITGYGSFETAAAAVNMGVSSYIIKPFSISDFIHQVERAAASRAFHLKSRLLLEASSAIAPNVRAHLVDITGLYHFSRKLMMSLELNEILRIILDEINSKVSAAFSAVGINFLDFSEIFVMPRTGRIDTEKVKTAILSEWSCTFEFLDKQRFISGQIPLTVFVGRHGQDVETAMVKPTAVLLNVMGSTIGVLVVFRDTPIIAGTSEYEYIYVFTSIISSIIEHGYMDLRARLQAKTDSLTGIANHRMFHEALSREIARSDRTGNEFGLVLMDIDNFKKINDTYGHLTGDAVLKDLAVRILSLVRRGDILARYGGEEFALILPDTDLQGCKHLSERICNEFASRPFCYNDKQIHYTLSLGIAVYKGSNSKSKDELFSEADAALYNSKKSGKNRFSVYT